MELVLLCQQVADLIGADPREIVFTSGATEANNMAIKVYYGIPTSNESAMCLMYRVWDTFTRPKRSISSQFKRLISDEFSRLF